MLYGIIEKQICLCRCLCRCLCIAVSMYPCFSLSFSLSACPDAAEICTVLGTPAGLRTSVHSKARIDAIPTIGYVFRL